MARIRTIKPEFFTSEDVVSLSPRARLLYVALWCEADREGRLVWKPRTFKLRYFPADDCDILALCQEVINAGLVKLYGDDEFAHIPKFAKHQHINPRESDSILPDPDAPARAKPRVGTRQLRDIDAQVGRGRKGKEGNTGEPNGSPVAATSPRPTKKPPPDLAMTPEMRAWAAENAPLVDAEAELAKLRDHTFATARSDWPGTFRNWLRKAQESAERNRPRNGHDEPEWRREQRERNEAFLGPYAKRKAANVIDMEASDGSAGILG